MGGGSHGGCFGGCLSWSCWVISRLLRKSKATVPNSQKIEHHVEALQVINGPNVTVEMCRASYDGQPNLYQHEIFQPLQPNPPGLPGADDFPEGKEPIDDEYAKGGVEAVGNSVDVGEGDVD